MWWIHLKEYCVAIRDDATDEYIITWKDVHYNKKQVTNSHDSILDVYIYTHVQNKRLKSYIERSGIIPGCWNLLFYIFIFCSSQFSTINTDYKIGKKIIERINSKVLSKELYFCVHSSYLQTIKLYVNQSPLKKSHDNSDYL